MLGKLAQMFGLGRPAEKAPETPGSQPPAAIAAKLDAKNLSDVAGRLAPSELPAVLQALGNSPLRADLAAQVLGARKGPSAELFQKVAAELTPVEREKVLGALPGALQSIAAKNGFDPFADLDAKPTSASD